MMIKAKGPVWHKKQKKQNIIPRGLHGIDREATWGKSATDGWVYGHGSFCITSYDIPIVGIFQWMPNSAHEAKRLKSEIVKYETIVRKVFMDSKADDQHLYFGLLANHQIELVTCPRRNMDKSPSRRKMIRQMLTHKNRMDYRKRAVTVEPMQALVKEIFDLETCWMRGDANNRWLFAAMGIAIQIAQWNAFKNRASTWKIKHDVLGL